MSTENDLKRMKSLVGEFYTEVKSNSISDFIIWLDCKMEYASYCGKDERDGRRFTKKG